MKPKIIETNPIVLALGVIMLSIGGLALVFASLAAPIKIAWLLAGVGIVILTLFLFANIAFIEEVAIKGEKVIFRSILRLYEKQVKKQDIKSYYKFKGSSSDSEWEETYLLTDGAKYRISSAVVANYKNISRILTAGKYRDIALEKKKIKTNKFINKLESIGLNIVVVVAVLFYIFTPGTTLTLSSLTKIEGTLSKEIGIVKSRKGGSITISLAEYPNYDFRLSGSGYHVANVSYLKAYPKVGDHFVLYITKDEMDKKILRTKEKTFTDINFSYSSISIYGIEDEEYQYLDPRKYLERINN